LVRPEVPRAPSLDPRTRSSFTEARVESDFGRLAARSGSFSATNGDNARRP
jgi:hypothetical protein